MLVLNIKNVDTSSRVCFPKIHCTHFQDFRNLTKSYIFVFLVLGLGHETPVFVYLLFDIYLLEGV